MKKIFSFVLALCAIITMANAAPKSVTVDCGNQVQLTATPKTGFHFLRWNDHNTDNPRTINPTQDSTFKAFFAINRYEIVFKNWNDAVLQQDSVDHGTAIFYNGDTPTKPSTAQYSYTFASWSPNIVSPAVGNATYVAQFDEIVNQYEIGFLNWDSTVLQSTKWNYGSTPVYSGATPTKPASAQYNYTFKGWDKTIASVTGATKYVAQFDSTTISYQISVIPNDANFGSTTGSGTYQYGTNVTITATPAECYEFVQWNDGNTNASRTITVTGVTTFTATFKKIQYTITVESNDETQGSADVKKL